MKKIIILLFLIGTFYCGYTQEITLSDFDIIQGEKWVGELTYLDYTADKKYSIPVEFLATKLKDGQYMVKYEYPDEPQENSKTKLVIDLKKNRIQKESIERIERNDGLIVVKSVSSGKDNGKAATLYKTYSFGSNDLIIRTEVSYEDSEEVFLRNEYRLRR